VEYRANGYLIVYYLIHTGKWYFFTSVNFGHTVELGRALLFEIITLWNKRKLRCKKKFL